MSEVKNATAYPRPQFERTDWLSLDGSWSFSFSETLSQNDVSWTHEITVPYPPESELSGIHDEGFHKVVWYKRSFETPTAWAGKRIRLHFGAVDYRARVWVNGQFVAEHEGGHTPFWADITEALGGKNEVVVCAEDDPLDLAKPRGKQDWLEEPHAIWYPRTTGIWQSVWLEPLAEAHLESLRLTPRVTDLSVQLEADIAGAQEGDRLLVTLSHDGKTLVEDSFTLKGSRVSRTLFLDDPGIDDARRAFLWSPEHPTLLPLTLEVVRGDTVLDTVESYTALRQVETRGGQFFLNSRPYFLRLALDQGYWDEGLLAPPNDEALRKDVELAKAMGFNGVRKHQKIEHPRYLYWADRLGLLVWEELPSAYAFTPETAPRLTKEWLEAVKRDYNHPCIVVWVAFNESWGVPELPASSEQRDLVAALYYLTKSLDSSRPVVGNDGWEHVVSDLHTIHDYTGDPEVLRERYGTAASAEETSWSVRPAGRDIVLDGYDLGDAPVILSEFGGIRYAKGGEGWGYTQVESAETLLENYRALIAAASEAGLAGFCYTQFADTFQEQNGLLFSDRTPKVPLEKLLEATAQRQR
jgi:beta-galactosidase/beta-glucuronidase